MPNWPDSNVTAEETAVAAFMERVARVPVTSRLPDPEVLWLKAQLVRRWAADRKIEAPLDLMAPIQIAAGLIATAMLLFWSVPSLVRALLLVPFNVKL